RAARSRPQLFDYLLMLLMAPGPLADPLRARFLRAALPRGDSLPGVTRTIEWFMVSLARLLTGLTSPHLPAVPSPPAPVPAAESRPPAGASARRCPCRCAATPPRTCPA